jgi:hypothetical protein
MGFTSCAITTVLPSKTDTFVVDVPFLAQDYVELFIPLCHLGISFSNFGFILAFSFSSEHWLEGTIITDKNMHNR